MNIENLKAQLALRIQEREDKQKKLDNFELDSDNYEEQFRGFIDEVSDEVVVLGMRFPPSRVLEELDPIAFSCGLADYVNNLDKTQDQEYQELEGELGALNDEISDLEDQISDY